jgi:hypothetical protein
MSKLSGPGLSVRYWPVDTGDKERTEAGLSEAGFFELVFPKVVSSRSPLEVSRGGREVGLAYHLGQDPVVVGAAAVVVESNEVASQVRLAVAQAGRLLGAVADVAAAEGVTEVEAAGLRQVFAVSGAAGLQTLVEVFDHRPAALGWASPCWEASARF